MDTLEKQQPINEHAKKAMRATRAKKRKPIRMSYKVVFFMDPPLQSETPEQYAQRMDVAFVEQMEEECWWFTHDEKDALVGKLMERVAADAGWPEEECVAAGDSHSESCNT